MKHLVSTFGNVSLRTARRQLMEAHEFFGPPPEKDLEYRLAYRLLGARSDIDRRVLGALVGRPQRFSDLKRVLGPRKDANLTQSLRRLHRDGLVRARLAARKEPATKIHELTPLGALVVFHIAEMSTAHRSAQALLRGKQAETA
jgi:DNA-binding HxlR family transcriptional regulator